jgi:hypothetical protein
MVSQAVSQYKLANTSSPGVMTRGFCLSISYFTPFI